MRGMAACSSSRLNEVMEAPGDAHELLMIMAPALAARTIMSASCASLAVISRGEYGIPEGLQFGFPVDSDGNGSWSVKEGFELDAFARDKIRITTEELQAEKADVADLL